MPQLIPMRTTTVFSRHGKEVEKDKIIEVPPLEAAALSFKRKARFLSKPEARSFEAERQSRSGAYQRRDMEAEDRSSTTSGASEGSPERGRSRRHNRRDLTAQE